MSNQPIDPQSNIERARTLLSPYIDGEVSAEEQQFVEMQLATSNDLRQELESLRQTVSMVAQLPQLTAPRPFTLSEADVGILPTASQSRFGLSNWFMGWAAMAATFVAMIVIGGTVFLNRQTLSTQELASVPHGAVAPKEAVVEQEEAVAEEKSTEESFQDDEAAVGTVSIEAAEHEATDSAPDMSVAESASVEENAAYSERFESNSEGDVETLTENEAVESEAIDKPPETEAVNEEVPTRPRTLVEENIEPSMLAETSVVEEGEAQLSMASEPYPSDDLDFSYQAEENASSEIATPFDVTTTRSTDSDIDSLTEEMLEEAEAVLQTTASAESLASAHPTVTPSPMPTDLPTVTPSPIDSSSSLEDVAPESGENGITWSFFAALILLLLAVGALLWGRSRRA